MIVSRNKDTALFRTYFSEDYDLIQKFSGLTEINAGFNNTVNFTEAGLMRHDKWDMWHIDIPFAYSNDEAPPVMINGKWLGANHAFPGAISLHIPDHGKTYADIGSLWRDAEDTKWTLINVAEDTLTFISENIGESDVKYAFKDRITSNLTYLSNGENTASINADVEGWKSSMAPIIRHTKWKVVAYIDGKPRIVNRQLKCDYAEIHEDYEIMNPVSMIDAISQNRPEKGYTEPINKAMGRGMVRVSRIYRIENDGTITCDFTCQKLMDIHMVRCIGAMFQEKLDTYGGGLYRYIPKTKPIDTPEGTFDFSTPMSTAPGPFPKNSSVTKDFWEYPLSPPDRITDYFRNANGDDCMGFVCGYLPIYDGVPEIRTKQLKSTILLASTRKGYPIFMEGDIEQCHGVAYRKYFEIPKNRTSVYTIPCEGKTYLYVDLFEENTLTIPTKGDITLYEKSGGISYKIGDGILTVSGKGYSTFIY